jgi:hypothetical protein
MLETGLLGKWIKTFNPETKECSLKSYNKNKNENSQITLKNLISALVLLLLGVFVSFVVFIIELIYHQFGLDSSCKISRPSQAIIL